MPVDSALVSEYIKKTLEKRKAESRASKLTGELAVIEEKLLESFTEDGVKNVKMENGTAYIGSQIWAGAPKDEKGNSDYATANAALEAAGLGDFVQPRFNANTLSAWIRELPRDKLDNPILPPELVGKIEVVTKWKIGVRAK